MNGVRKLLHNLTFLFSSNTHHPAWSSDLLVGTARHGSPHGQLAAVSTGLTMAVICCIPCVPQLAF